MRGNRRRASGRSSNRNGRWRWARRRRVELARLLRKVRRGAHRISGIGRLRGCGHAGFDERETGREGDPRERRVRGFRKLVQWWRSLTVGRVSFLGVDGGNRRCGVQIFADPISQNLDGRFRQKSGFSIFVLDVVSCKNDAYHRR